jgi:hypothetical protein
VLVELLLSKVSLIVEAINPQRQHPNSRTINNMKNVPAVVPSVPKKAVLKAVPPEAL